MMAALSMTEGGFVVAARTVLVRATFDEGISSALAGLLAGLADRGARVAVISGLGDPAGDVNPALSLSRFAEPLRQATGKPVIFIGESVGTGAEARLAKVGYGEIALLENLRFHPDERRRDRVFAMRLSVLGDFFVDAGNPATRGPWFDDLRELLPEPALLDHDKQLEQEA